VLPNRRLWCLECNGQHCVDG